MCEPIDEPPGARLSADSIHSTGTRVTRASPVWPAEPIWLDPQAGSPPGRHPLGTNRSWEGTSQWEHEAEVPAETFKTQCPRADPTPAVCSPASPVYAEFSKKGTNWKRCHFQKRDHSAAHGDPTAPWSPRQKKTPTPSPPRPQIHSLRLPLESKLLPARDRDEL